MSTLPVLVLNSGSSSIKFAIYEAGNGQRTKLNEGAVDGIGTDNGKFWIKDAGGKKLVDKTPDLPNRAVAFKLVADALHSGEFPLPKAIGHRTVCGGPTVRENQRITSDLIDEIESYADLAPLHTPIAVYIMREALRLFPGIPNFAVLDTYFHRTMPEVVTHMPIPWKYVGMGVRRYASYHGISYGVDHLSVAAQHPRQADRGAPRQWCIRISRDPQQESASTLQWASLQPAASSVAHAQAPAPPVAWGVS